MGDEPWAGVAGLGHRAHEVEGRSTVLVTYAAPQPVRGYRHPKGARLRSQHRTRLFEHWENESEGSADPTYKDRLAKDTADLTWGPLARTVPPDVVRRRIDAKQGTDAADDSRPGPSALWYLGEVHLEMVALLAVILVVLVGSAGRCGRSRAGSRRYPRTCRWQ